jgi:hypothetical protein
MRKKREDRLMVQDHHRKKQTKAGTNRPHKRKKYLSKES